MSDHTDHTPPATAPPAPAAPGPESETEPGTPSATAAPGPGSKPGSATGSGTEVKSGTAAGTDSETEAIGYAAALTELDGILRELDGDEVDVDVLGTRVRRAAELLRVCRDRIASARFDVEQVVAELEADNKEGDPAPPTTE